MWPEDTPRPENNPYNFKYTIPKQDIQEFVNSLHVLQEHYMDAALEASDMKDAKEVLDRIMKL